MDITDNPPDDEPLQVNFTYTVEWRQEKFLDYPHRHSRYFRIFLFYAERLRGQHRHIGAAWGKILLYAMMGMWLRFLYLRGSGETHSRQTSIRSWAMRVEWLPPPTTLGHVWWDAAFLAGLQANVIVVVQCFFIWQSLVSPMRRGELLQSILLTYLLTCPAIGYLAERRSTGWWRVLCLWTFPSLVVWYVAQKSLPENCTGRLTARVIIRLVVGVGCGSWGLACLGARFSKIPGQLNPPLHKKQSFAASIPALSSKYFTSLVDACPFLLWGLVPLYFWSEHISYGLECLWGRQFYVNVGVLWKAWVHSSLLLGLGCVSIHHVLSVNAQSDESGDAAMPRRLRRSFGAGVVVGLSIWINSFHYFYYESCIPGQDSSGSQTYLYFGYTTLLCAILSCMYASVAVCGTFLWEHYRIAIQDQVRCWLDSSMREVRRQILCLWQHTYVGFSRRSAVRPTDSSGRDE